MSEKEKPAARKRKNRRRIRRWIALGIVVVLAGGAGFLAVRKLRHDYTVTYDAYTTSIGTISNSLNFSGSLQLVNSETYTADKTVKVREVYVSAGDKVSEGDRLMRLSDGTALNAEFDGTVSKLEAEKGDEVKKDETLLQVTDFRNMQVSFRVGESEISQVHAGQDVRITVASAGAVFQSKIRDIDYAAYTGNNVAYYTATVDVDTSGAEEIYPGMQATVTVTKEEVKDAVILKMEAVSTAMDNTAFVYLQAEDGTMERQPVTVGVSNGNYIEVKEGLSEGQTVYAVAKKEEEGGGLFAELFGSQQVNMPGGNRPGRTNEQRNRNYGDMPSNFGPNR